MARHCFSHSTCRSPKNRNSVRRFTLLTRPGCHLCEDFEAEVLAEFGGRLEIDAVQVDHHPAWLAEYGLGIPVLLDARERFVCEVRPDANAIEAALKGP